MVRWTVTRTTLHNWRRRGLLPAPIRIGPNVVGWPVEEVEAFERERPRAK
jgi:predicted DNA-binding transcriptional regulator AlpA